MQKRGAAGVWPDCPAPVKECFAGTPIACRADAKKPPEGGNAVQLRLFYVPNVVALGPGFDHTGA
ncbi:hypothetical protein, partial [Burkholderia stagnalis]|uniref:hypothetical protein n=1 Tax=Burkholderia stagnalis TaxID=1503054 RepID=UPI001C8A7F41